MKNTWVLTGIVGLVVVVGLLYWNTTRKDGFIETVGQEQVDVQGQADDLSQGTTTEPEQVSVESQKQSQQDGATQSPSSTPKPAAQTQPVKQVVPQTSFILLAENKSGSYVTVTSARLAKPGYVVVYRTNSKEQTGMIGRSALLDAGYYANLLVQLDQPVAREQVITAVLHVDDGDGKFEFPVSDVYMTNGSQKYVYDEDVIDTPAAEETGLINGTVEEHLKDAKEVLQVN